MPKPSIGQPNWGQTLNDFLDEKQDSSALDVDVAGHLSTTGSSAETVLSERLNALSASQAASLEADVAAKIGTAGALDDALSATYASKWRAETAYVAGDVRQAPDGSTIRRNTNGTSAATFTTTELAAPVLAAPTTATTGGTLAAATYYYKATAINAVGETIGSNEVSIATTGTTSTVGLSWAAITGATGYKIYRATATGGQSTSPALVASVGAVTTYTDTGTAVTAGAVPATGTTSEKAHWTAVAAVAGTMEQVALSATYAAVTSVNARQKLLTPGATAVDNRTALTDALEAAATDGAPIALRGAFPVSGAPVAPSGAVHIDATEATFTQADDLTPILILPSGSRLHGGEFVGKGTDWVNTSSVYAANAVQLASGASDVTLYGVKGSGLAGAGVYAATAVSGIRLIHCDFEGVGSAVIPANTGQYSGAFVINTNGSTDIAVVGGTYRGFAQGLHGGTVDDLFIGGGVTLSAAGQHAIYYGPIQSGVISGFIIEGAGLEGIKAQITSGTGGEQTSQLVIGHGVIRGINSHAVHLANTEDPYATRARRTIISDLVVDHAAGQGGETVLLEYASEVSVHDVISNGARRVVSALNSTGLDVHHVRGTGYAQSGISLNDVTDSTFDQIRLIDGSTANNVNEEWGIHVNGAASANLRFSNSRITDSLGNAAFLVRVLAGDLATMSFSGLSGSGATSHGWRSHVSTATALWHGNDLQGTSGEFFNTPANAAAIADTSGAALATLEAEVNKIKARLRTTGQIN